MLHLEVSLELERDPYFLVLLDQIGVPLYRMTLPSFCTAQITVLSPVGLAVLVCQTGLPLVSLRTTRSSTHMQHAALGYRI